ncbi:MAG TPA: aldo/keto reductase [Burkholderiaceae bacterium]|nr:aldo/keto reductase [Burkholderiaceae bacterium]
MDHVNLGAGGPAVSRVGLGTMTFGEQVPQADAFAILDRALERGVTLIDTAEMYPVPARRETYTGTETIIGNWFAARPGARQRVVLATKVAGPSRGMDWVRGGSNDLEPEHIAAACHESLRRLRTEVIDLYQIHWPNRNAPSFGALYFDPTKDRDYTSIQQQLQALSALVRDGKVRHIGLSNETPWGLAEFVRVAETHGLARVVSVQNPYTLVNRVVDNGLDEALHRTGVSLLAYSPLGFGTLTGKYDEVGMDAERPQLGRLARFASMRGQRWGRAETLAAARRYNALAREAGLTPTRMALAFVYGNWRVASTLIGVTSRAQLDECLDAWGTALPSDLLARIDAIRREIRDPAQ